MTTTTETTGGHSTEPTTNAHPEHKGEHSEETTRKPTHMIAPAVVGTAIGVATGAVLVAMGLPRPVSTALVLIIAAVVIITALRRNASPEDVVDGGEC